MTECGGKFDALDQPEDTPTPGETLYAYETKGQNGAVHINMGRGRGGFYPICEYALCKTQPKPLEIRSTAKWRAWCEANQ